MDTIVMTGHVNPSASGNAFTGSGEIENEATAWGEPTPCSGTWSTKSRPDSSRLHATVNRWRL